MKKIEIYESEDGLRIFDNKWDCEAYERKTDAVGRMKDVLSLRVADIEDLYDWIIGNRELFRD